MSISDKLNDMLCEGKDKLVKNPFGTFVLLTTLKKDYDEISKTKKNVVYSSKSKEEMSVNDWLKKAKEILKNEDVNVIKKDMDLNELKKSKYASEVLQLMDTGDEPDYLKSLKTVLKKYPHLNREKLEKELENWI